MNENGHLVNSTNDQFCAEHFSADILTIHFYLRVDSTGMPL